MRNKNSVNDKWQRVVAYAIWGCRKQQETVRADTRTRSTNQSFPAANLDYNHITVYEVVHSSYWNESLMFSNPGSMSPVLQRRLPERRT